MVGFTETKGPISVTLTVSWADRLTPAGSATWKVIGQLRTWSQPGVQLNDQVLAPVCATAAPCGRLDEVSVSVVLGLDDCAVMVSLSAMLERPAAWSRRGRCSAPYP